MWPFTPPPRLAPPLTGMTQAQMAARGFKYGLSPETRAKLLAHSIILDPCDGGNESRKAPTYE